MSSFEMGATTRVALERLLEVAQGSDAQARRTADFLLAWWDPDLHGGFALNNLWDMDDDVSRACVLVFAWIAANRADPRQVGYGPQFEALFASSVEWGRYGEWLAGNEAIGRWSSGLAGGAKHVAPLSEVVLVRTDKYPDPLRSTSAALSSK